MPFGQVVIGPPGSGKTTYCAGAAQFLRAAARRKVAVVNLDPANDGLPYEPEVDVRELVCLESVMEELGLGPNGGAPGRACGRMAACVFAHAAAVYSHACARVWAQHIHRPPHAHLYLPQAWCTA